MHHLRRIKLVPVIEFCETTAHRECCALKVTDHIAALVIVRVMIANLLQALRKDNQHVHVLAGHIIAKCHQIRTFPHVASRDHVGSATRYGGTGVELDFTSIIPCAAVLRGVEHHRASFVIALCT